MPVLIEYVSVPYPPLPDTGIKEYDCEFLVRLDDGASNVELSAGKSATVILKLLLLDCGVVFESVTVMV